MHIKGQDNIFKNKKVLVMGLGLHGGGVEATRWLKRQRADVLVTDIKTKRELASSINKLKKFRGIKYNLGGHDKRDFLEADIILKGPGVPSSSSYLKLAVSKKIPVLSDVGIFLSVLKNRANIIAVTGTKGKSTTANLIYRVLSRGPKKTFLAGNIGRSVFEILPKIKKGDFVVLELSSFQLEDIASRGFRFPVAVITSLFPDHLNRHKTFSAYIKAKEIIFKYQNKNNFLVINGDDKNAKKSAKKANGTVLCLKEKDFAGNCAYIIGKYFGVSDKKINSAIKSFKGLPGRMEKIFEKNGVLFINDTTATNPVAGAYGINRARAFFTDNKHPILAVIAGGYDKGLDVRDYVAALRKYVDFAVFLPGKASDKIIRAIKRSGIKYIIVKTMKEAVKKAYAVIKPTGGVVLLSPGAASFGLFKHEFDRGDKFIKAVKEIK